MTGLFKQPISDKAFLIALVVIHGIYFVFALSFRHIYLTDSFEYLYQAENIRNSGSFYSSDFHNTIILMNYTLRTPLYGFFLFLIKLISSSQFTILFIQCCLSILNLMGLNRILKKYSFSNNTPLIILLALILYPSQLIYANMIMSEIILQTFLFWAFCCVLFYLFKQELKYLFLYNILLSLAVLTKPVLVYFWIPNIIFSSFLFFENRKWQVLFYSFFLPLTIILWSSYNKHITGYFHYSSIKTYNLYESNARLTLAKMRGDSSARVTINRIVNQSFQFKTLKEKSEFLDRQSLGIIKNNFGQYALVHLTGMMRFMFDAGRYDIVNFFPQDDKKELSFFSELYNKGITGLKSYLSSISIFIFLASIIIVIWNILLAAGFISFLFNANVNYLIRLFVFIIISYMCFVTGPVGCSRLRSSIFPILLFTLLFFIDQFEKLFLNKYLTVK